MNDLMLRRREMAQANGPAPLIPAEYQQVEYLSCTGTTGNGPFFNTGYQGTMTGTLTLEVDCMRTSFYNTNAGAPIGVPIANSSGTTGAGAYIVFPSGDTKTVSAIGGATVSVTAEAALTNTRNTIIATFDSAGNQTIEMGELSNSGIAETPKNYKGYASLFGVRKGSSSTISYMFRGRIYHAKISEDGVLKRDLYPCYRKEDNTPGFYDIVTKSFKTRQGSSTATITLGPDVN